MTRIKPPFDVYYDDNGEPLEAGNIFIGVANQNPVTFPVSVFFDEAQQIPADQPIRTLAGYPDLNGSPANLFTASADFSITVNDKNDEFIYSKPSQDSAAEAVELGYKPIIPFFFGGVPLTNELLGEYIAPQNFVFPKDLPDSKAHANIAPAAQTILTVFKIEGVSEIATEVGTITFAAAANDGVFSWAAAVSLVAGDLLSVVAPVSVDATISGIAITFRTEQVVGALNSVYAADFFVDSGTAAAHILSPVGLTVTPSALDEGISVAYRANIGNTGAVTINVDGLGAVALTLDGVALTGGEIIDDQYIEARFTLNGNFFYIVNGTATAIAQALPVGFLLASTLVANPNTYLGYGTWVAIAQGRMLIGVGQGTDINAVNKTITNGETGGEYEHKQVVAEIGEHFHTFRQLEDGNDGGIETAPEQGANAQVEDGISNINQAQASVTAMQWLPPYFGCSIWERTA